MSSELGMLGGLTPPPHLTLGIAPAFGGLALSAPFGRDSPAMRE